MDSTVVTLSENNHALSFEEAFGEFSNAKGKGVFKKAAEKVAQKVAAPIKQAVSAPAAVVHAAQSVSKKVSAPIKSVVKKSAAVVAKKSTPASAPPTDASDSDDSDEETTDEETEEDDSEDTGFDGSKKHIQNIIDNMENATVVRLSNASSPEVVSFEEAFGEHSNLFGGKKRTARVLARQANKRARKAARAETKIEKQQDKGAVKAARQQKKATKKVARVQKHTDVMAARQNKKTQRKQMRQDRKNMGQDDSTLPDDPTLQDDTTAQDDTVQQDATTDTSGQYAEQALQDGGSDNTGYEDPNPIQRDAVVDDSGDFTDPYAQDADSGDDGSQDQSDDGSGDDESADDGYEDSFIGEMSSFNGNMESLSPTNKYSYKVGNEPYTKTIHPKVADAARKAEWNKEMVSRLEGSLQESNLVDAQDEARQELLDQISNHKQRAMHHEAKLKSYVDASNADGVSAQRGAEVNAAKREARKQRMLVHANSAAKAGRSTKIQSSLNPKVSSDRIEIPAHSNLVSEHESNLVSEHESNLVSEHDYSFSGVELIKKINWKGVAVGVLGAAILITVISLASKHKTT